MRLPLCLAVLPGFAMADAPVVVTDIAPVHSLVARVMEGVGSPELLLPPTASPHDFALRPSDARKLNSADAVIWVGEALTPFLEDPIHDLATGAETLELLETEGWEKREYGDHDDHANDDHDHDDHAHGDHDHDHDDHADDHADEHAEDDHDHDDHAHDEHAHDEHAHDHDDHADDHAHGDHDHDDHAHGHGHGHGHDHHHHEGIDPHAWLDPMVAAEWVVDIAETLAAADPENAATYAANSETARAELVALTDELSAQLADVSGGYIVPHDAYGYFAARFDLPEAGHIASVDAHAPGPAHIRNLQEQIAQQGISCVLTDPQTSAGWTELLRAGTDLKSAHVDPIGGQLTPGADLYPALLRDMSEQIAICLQ